MENYGIFDIVGPIMIGPSSSHTAGAARIGKVARYISGPKIKSVRFFLYGSFSKTYLGHGTDKALVAGILGMEPSDERLANSLQMAKELGIYIEFLLSDLTMGHPNTVKIEIENVNGNKTYVTGSSVGGGAIVITDVNGYQINFTDEYPTIMITHRDKRGMISRVSSILSANEINIAKMAVSRKTKGDVASMTIETDSPITPELTTILGQVEDVLSIRVINPVREEQ